MKIKLLYKTAAAIVLICAAMSCHSSRNTSNSQPDPVPVQPQQTVQPKLPQEKPPVNIEETLPGCIETLIAEIKKAPVTNPPTVVTEYMYHSVRVYHISAPCCDQMSRVVGEDCQVVCRPDGGITGKGDGKCPGFFGEAQQLRVVFSDERVGK